ncbi:LysR family transcriptional regulator [Brevibacterium sp. 50QC2O2]|uniref:LysR family transcriptional regulator n=1 Tax=Brevibacterium sp. 50QC2O2 TaxID=2968459 RepID=UPI00211C3FE9|nr:LysR family transcriptional regulator [Brevibacterium sp. 50QC2O2]MCQ9388214.1 LysR family transcriptional regulator [Brevibacterium sp. 50QC2O2]
MHISNLDLNLIRSLHVLLEERSVTAAARRLGITQGACSHALGRLRTVFADELLYRSGREMLLTPEADRLLPITSELLGIVENRLLADDFDPGTEANEFNLLLPDFISAVALHEIYARLSGLSPDSTLAPWTLTHANMTQFLDRKNFGVAMVPTRRVPAGMSSEPVGRATFKLMAGRHNRLVHPDMTTAEYAALPHIVIREALIHEVIEAELAGRGLHLNTRITMETTPALRSLVTSSELVALTWHGARRSPDVRILDLPVSNDTIEFSLVWPTILDTHRPTVWLRGLVHDVIAGHLQE